LKMFVIKVVSLPKYVKGVHFFVVMSVFWMGARLDSFGVGVFRVGIGTPLFCMILWMVSSSSPYSLYKLTCHDCNKVYVGQTGWSFAQKFKEHKDAFKFSRNNSNYAKHAQTHSHSFGPIHTTMQILQYQNKGAHLNTI
jgi:hypothetical protein